MDSTPVRRRGPPPRSYPASLPRPRETRLAVVLFWAAALLLVGARVAFHDGIAREGAAPGGIVSVGASRSG